MKCGVSNQRNKTMTYKTSITSKQWDNIETIGHYCLLYAKHFIRMIKNCIHTGNRERSYLVIFRKLASEKEFIFLLLDIL